MKSSEIVRSPRMVTLEVVIAVVLTVSADRLQSGQIHVGPGGDFTDIQPAIDAALDGDVILVEPGTYTAFRLAKGVVIRSAAPGQRFDVQLDGAPAYVV